MNGTTPYNGLGCSALVVNDRCHEPQPSPIVTLHLLLGAGKVFVIVLSLLQNEFFVILNEVKDLYLVGKDRFFAALRMTKEEKI